MGKNIVLLSDGTGNGSASAFKTNVWRLYQAIDINPPKTGNEPVQIAFYDGGVGADGIKPLALLGQAFGLGLARNVKDLYTFLCRNYKEGDGIYLFGFSRGAFTVRVVAGLVLRCGLVRADNEADLLDRVEHAYDEYKLDVARRATGAYRALAARPFLGSAQDAYRRDHLAFGFEQIFPKITFIGVWDTVDAYGMPIDEIKLGIDKYLWPMTLADQKLSKHVDRACQALSLDDERPTFRPVLWDESNAPTNLTQVWFSGVHANVGGGYPDDGLAHLTLQWMMDEAEAYGLVFYDHAKTMVDAAANLHGEQYDSRSGLAGYFRYGPRIVDTLCQDSDHGVVVSIPKVHKASIDRIKTWQTAYAPVSFPSTYSVMERSIKPPGLKALPQAESSAEVQHRQADMEMAWDAVARRRFVYFATVTLSALLVLLPLRAALPSWIEKALPSGLATSMNQFGNWLATPFNAVAYYAVAFGDFLGALPGVGVLTALIVKLFDIAKGLLWSWTEFLFDWYQRHPLFSFVLVVMLAWLFIRTSNKLQDEIFARADFAWRRLRKSPPPGGGGPARSPNPKSDPLGSDTPQPPPPGGGSARIRIIDRLVRGLRKNRIVATSYWFIATRIIPFLFALLAFAFILIGLFFLIPKFYRQAQRRRRYATKGSPDDSTPAPRIPRTPIDWESDGEAKDIPERAEAEQGELVAAEA